jgi:hypothetical protein
MSIYYKRDSGETDSSGAIIYQYIDDAVLPKRTSPWIEITQSEYETALANYSEEDENDDAAIRDFINRFDNFNKTPNGTAPSSDYIIPDNIGVEGSGNESVVKYSSIMPPVTAYYSSTLSKRIAVHSHILAIFYAHEDAGTNIPYVNATTDQAIEILRTIITKWDIVDGAGSNITEIQRNGLKSEMDTLAASGNSGVTVLNSWTELKAKYNNESTT